ncbi:MAG: hypothetical protein ACKOJF_22335, partial [Planctomycetaceae bacterium]
MFTVSYGKSHADLPGYVARLVPPTHAPGDGPIVVPPSPPRRSPAVAAYLSRLADSTSTIELLGLGRSLQIQLPISEAYVPLTANLARALTDRPTERVDSLEPEDSKVVELRDVFA